MSDAAAKSRDSTASRRGFAQPARDGDGPRLAVRSLRAPCASVGRVAPATVATVADRRKRLTRRAAMAHCPAHGRPAKEPVAAVPKSYGRAMHPAGAGTQSIGTVGSMTPSPRTQMKAVPMIAGAPDRAVTKAPA
jgi:hypothetical protein